PFDEESILDLAKKTGRVLCVEENSIIGGFGAAVCELLSEKGLGIPIHRHGVPDRFVEHGTQSELRTLLGLDQLGIAQAARYLLGIPEKHA
ncbi:MAG: 1-deoxy-D-xylulose-5-phosphate synthase, partial [Deltaproteobacteria bacterium]|nr:1-deoxy-D-xylulose-5-phosphate synthase [Deltaproteobacteria bacterium]